VDRPDDPSHLGLHSRRILIMTRTTGTIRRFLGLLTAAVVLTGCDVLSVPDPGSIDESQLTDPAMEMMIVNGVRGEFQYAHAYSSLWTGVLTDELLLHHTYFPTVAIALRRLEPANVYVENLNAFWQRARQSADDAVPRLEKMFGQEAGQSLSLAQVQAYTLMGETFCEAPVDLSRAYSATELLEMSLPAFDEAIRVASRARVAGADAGEASHLIDFARLGKARALLNLDRRAEAAAAAREVGADFEMWIPHNSNSTREHNPFYGPTTGQNNRYVSIGGRFVHLGDPRVPHSDPLGGLVSGSTYVVPHRPMNHRGWQTGHGVPFAEDVDIRFASHLEGRYIIAEAEGPTAATLQFVTERRLAGGQAEATLSGLQLMAELREQRARDFYLTGRRLGDLRRYLGHQKVDLFPRGTDPYHGQLYGGSTCIPISRSEINANPNL
jgi:hypothetical protein